MDKFNWIFEIGDILEKYFFEIASEETRYKIQYELDAYLANQNSLGYVLRREDGKRITKFLPIFEDYKVNILLQVE